MKISDRSRSGAIYWSLLFILVTALLLLFGNASQFPLKAEGEGLDLTPYAYMPIIRNDPIPTLPPSSVEAALRITPSGGINASTYTPGSFILTSATNHNAKIEKVHIDLGTAMFPDMVFDPFGTAGDTVAKDLEIDSDPSVVGFLNHAYDTPHDGGFDGLTLYFDDFDPGEQVTFSVDVDPTSIKGSPAPGPNESGSVSGLELAGATVTTTFSNSLELSTQTFRIQDSPSGSVTLIREGLPPRPIVEIVGHPVTPVTVTNSIQTVRITGLQWTSFSVLVVEGGQFIEGLPGGGFDVGPYEANSAIAIHEYLGTTNVAGVVDVPVLLTRGRPDAGYNHIVVVFEDYFGQRGLTSVPIVLKLE